MNETVHLEPIPEAEEIKEELNSFDENPEDHLKIQPQATEDLSNLGDTIGKKKAKKRLKKRIRGRVLKIRRNMLETQLLISIRTKLYMKQTNIMGPMKDLKNSNKLM